MASLPATIFGWVLGSSTHNLENTSGESPSTPSPLPAAVSLSPPAAGNPPVVSTQAPQEPISIPSEFASFEDCRRYLRNYEANPAGPSPEQWRFAWTSNLPGQFNPVPIGKPMFETHLLTATEDLNSCTAWIDELEKVLIFAGLFSGVVTAFAIQAYQILQENPNDISARMLTRIATQLSNPSAQIVAPLQSSPKFSPPRWAVLVNIVWFTSLSLSLTAALAGILCMQWIRAFRRETNLSDKDKLSLRQLRYEGLQDWHVPTIMTALPVMLQIALLLFFAGLLQFMWNLNRTLAISLFIVLGPVILCYFISTIAPAAQFWYGKNWFMGSQCPYKSPQAWIVYKCTVYIAAFIAACFQIFRHGASLLREKRFSVGVPVDPEKASHAAAPSGTANKPTGNSPPLAPVGNTAATLVEPASGAPVAAIVPQSDAHQSAAAATTCSSTAASMNIPSIIITASPNGETPASSSSPLDDPDPDNIVAAIPGFLDSAQTSASNVTVNTSSSVDTPARTVSDSGTFHPSRWVLPPSSPAAGKAEVLNNSNLTVHTAVPSATASATASRAESAVGIVVPATANSNAVKPAEPPSHSGATIPLPTDVQASQIEVTTTDPPAKKNPSTGSADNNLINPQGGGSTSKMRRHKEGRIIQTWNEYDFQWRHHRHLHNSDNEFLDFAKALDWIISTQPPRSDDLRFVILALCEASRKDPDAAILVLENLRGRHLSHKEVILPCLLRLLHYLSEKVDLTDPSLSDFNLVGLKSDIVLACSTRYFPPDHQIKPDFINSCLELCIRILNAPIALGLWDIKGPTTLEACPLFSYFQHTFQPTVDRFHTVNSSVLEQLIYLVASKPLLNHSTKTFNMPFEIFYLAVREVGAKQREDEYIAELRTAILFACHHLEGWMSEKSCGLDTGDREGLETLLNCVAWVFGAFGSIPWLTDISPNIDPSIFSEWTRKGSGRTYEAPPQLTKLIKASIVIFTAGIVLQKSTKVEHGVGIYFPDAWGRPVLWTSNAEQCKSILEDVIKRFKLEIWVEREFGNALENLNF